MSDGIRTRDRLDLARPQLRPRRWFGNPSVLLLRRGPRYKAGSTWLIAVTRGAVLAERGPVIAGYDGSEHSLQAARHGVALAAGLRRGLVLLHVADGDKRVDITPGLADELAGDDLSEHFLAEMLRVCSKISQNP